MSIQLFFLLFLYSDYFYFVDTRVVCIVSVRGNPSSSVLFYVVFLSLHRCIHAVLNAGKSSSYFFSWFIQSISSLGFKALCIVMNLLILLFICWSSSLNYFKNCPEYLTRGTAKAFIPLMRFLLRSLISSKLLFNYGLILHHLELKDHKKCERNFPFC